MEAQLALTCLILQAWAVGFTEALLREDVDDDCVGCICESSHNRCESPEGGCNVDLCGMYAITEPFWADGGRPTLYPDKPHDEGAFVRCVNDHSCAAETIRHYMEKYADDCNEDGVIDCHDYARIFLFGPHNCHQSLIGKVDSKFQPCMWRLGRSEQDRWEQEPLGSHSRKKRGEGNWTGQS